MQNIEQLRNSLSENYDKMRSKEMDLKTGKELANTAGKILSSLKLQLEYNTWMSIKKQIQFMEV